MVTIPAAVRELRRVYGLAQQGFASLLGMSIASIANFETGSRVPDGVSAVKLSRAAQQKERDDLADAFTDIIYDAMGGMVMPIRNEEERRKVRAVQLILSDPKFEHLRKPLNKLLTPVEKHIRESAAFLRLETADMSAVSRQMIQRAQQQAEQGKRRK